MDRSMDLQPRRTPPNSNRLLSYAVIITVLVGIGFVVLAMASLFLGGESHASRETTASSAEPVTVAMVRLVGGRALWPSYVDVLESMGDSLDRPVEAMFLYGVEEVDGIFEKYENVDGAFMSTCAYLRARGEDPGMTRLVIPVIDGHQREQAVLVVRADSPYETLSDLRGARAALMETSLAGSAFPRWLLEQEGRGSAEEFFGVVETRDSQEANLRRVIEGLVDITAANRSQLASWPENSFRIIARSQEYGMPPFVVSSRLSDDEAEMLMQALTSFENRGEEGASRVLDGFVRGNPADYDFPMELMECLTIDNENYPQVDAP